MFRLSSRKLFLSNSVFRFAAAAASASSSSSSSAASASLAARKGNVLGDSVTIDPTAFSSLPKEAIAKLPEVDRLWLNIDGPHRARLSKFIKKNNNFCATSALQKRETGVQALNNATERPTLAKMQPNLAPAVKAFIEAGKKDVATLFETYDTLSLLIKGLEREREIIQLDIWGYNDAIQLGLKFFSQEKLTEKKKALTQATKDIAAVKAVIKSTCEAAFTTEVMNDMLNILRIISTDNNDGNARELGVQILDDLSLFQTAFNGETQLLFRNLVFGDLPHDDSGLLFELVEASVGGSVSVSALPSADIKKVSPELDAVADDTLKVISNRFQTPLSPELVKLRQVETHPLLQRSLE